MTRPALVLASTLLLTACATGPYRSAEAWCVGHHPCDWASHVATTAGTSAVAERVTGIDARIWGTGWLVYYGAREIRQQARWGPRTPDASPFMNLPLWADGIIDMATATVSAYWIGPWLADWIGG